MYQKSACFNHEDFSGKEQNLHSWNYSQVPDYQDFQIIRRQIKGILLYSLFRYAQTTPYWSSCSCVRVIHVCHSFHSRFDGAFFLFSQRNSIEALV